MKPCRALLSVFPSLLKCELICIVSRSHRPARADLPAGFFVERDGDFVDLFLAGFAVVFDFAAPRFFDAGFEVLEVAFARVREAAAFPLPFFFTGALAPLVETVRGFFTVPCRVFGVSLSFSSVKTPVTACTKRPIGPRAFSRLSGLILLAD